MFVQSLQHQQDTREEENSCIGVLWRCQPSAILRPYAFLPQAPYLGPSDPPSHQQDDAGRLRVCGQGGALRSGEGDHGIHCLRSFRVVDRVELPSRVDGKGCELWRRKTEDGAKAEWIPPDEMTRDEMTSGLGGGYRWSCVSSFMSRYQAVSKLWSASREDAL